MTTAVKAVAAEHRTAAAAAATRPPAMEVAAPHSACAHRRPYHVVLTAAAGLYQEWQTRLAYYHYKKLKAAHPCSDLGGFTRLLNTRGAAADGLVHEIPTVLVQQLSQGGSCDTCDHNFVVMNRPYGVVQYVGSDEYAAIEEEYILLMETDHLLLRPIPNVATEATPAAYGFYYMTYRYDARKLKPVISKYHDPLKVDPVGPSPLLINKAQLARVARPWWELCLRLKRDKPTDKAFGWVLEMWGWALNMARLGISHKVQPTLQAEPGGPGIGSLDGYSIYHYTFDLCVEKPGPRPRALKAEHKPECLWKWSKRDHMAAYPKLLAPPPAHAHSSTKQFVALINEAIRELGAGWRHMPPPGATQHRPRRPRPRPREGL